MRIGGVPWAVRDPDAVSAILAALHADRRTDTARGPPEATTRPDQVARALRSSPAAAPNREPERSPAPATRPSG